MTSPIEDAHSELTFQDIDKQPKISPLGSCYNYKKLEKEGLVENPDDSDVIEAEKEFTTENDPYGGH